MDWTLVTNVAVLVICAANTIGLLMLHNRVTKLEPYRKVR